MRRNSVFTQRGANMEIAMTPMIDVVFLLLVFFIWTASFQVVEQALPSAVSVSSGSAPSDLANPPPPEADFDEVVIRIRGAQDTLSWEVNEVPLDSLPALRGYLGQLAAINAEAPVILHPDPEVPLGAAIDVYDLARLQNFHVAFATPLTAESPSP